MVEILVREHEFPVRAACRVAGLSRTAWYRRPGDPLARDGAVVDALQVMVEKRPRWGFWKCFDRLRLDGHPWNHKRVYGAPAAIRCDNGPEFVSSTFFDWCEERKITVRYIQPGKPDQNAYMERFNRSYRGDVLDAWVFGSIAEVQDLSDEWLADYNENRPHDSLGGIPRAQFLPRSKDPEVSSFRVCV